ncbi:hypothetical protein CRG98_002232 [Punica granatum]|uniref:Uncharacterized protein n=1 Tax=Punica granatum TaxID=22663 RepID=A0A2I0L9B1_PUNGR|nr:hypothetical protein CRG98_002232 [Punica granatum]
MAFTPGMRSPVISVGVSSLKELNNSVAMLDDTCSPNPSTLLNTRAQLGTQEKKKRDSPRWAGIFAVGCWLAWNWRKSFSWPVSEDLPMKHEKGKLEAIRIRQGQVVSSEILVIIGWRDLCIISGFRHRRLKRYGGCGQDSKLLGTWDVERWF